MKYSTKYFIGTPIRTPDGNGIIFYHGRVSRCVWVKYFNGKIAAWGDWEVSL